MKKGTRVVIIINGEFTSRGIVIEYWGEDEAYLVNITEVVNGVNYDNDFKYNGGFLIDDDHVYIDKEYYRDKKIDELLK